MTVQFPRNQSGQPMLPNPMPEPDLLTEFPELQKAAADLDRLRQESNTVAANIKAAEAERRQAEHRDIQAQADAIRGGAVDPQRTVPAVDAKIEDLQRRVQAVRVAQAAAANDLADVMLTHRAAYLEMLAKRIAARRSRLANLVEEYGEARFALAELEAMAQWVGEFAERPRGFRVPVAQSIRVVGPLRQRGEGIGLSVLLETMRSDAEGPRTGADTYDEAA